MSKPDINRFSFSRLDQVWAFYEPGIKKYLLWTLLLVTVGFAFAFLSYETKSVKLFSISTFFVGLPPLFGATAFAFYKDRSFTCQLPATAAERFFFILLFTFIVVPAATFIAWFGLDGIAVLCGSDEILINSYKRYLDYYQNMAPTIDMIPLAKASPYLRVLTDILPASVALYLVIACKKQRFMTAVGGIIVCWIAVGLISGILAATKIFPIAKQYAGTAAFENQVGEATANAVYDIMLTMTAVSPALAIIVTYLAWRKFNSFQV